MCGICGVMQVGQPISVTIGRRMLRELAHRGPDDEGVAVFEAVETRTLLGSRRLAIIDLSPAGHQPMVSADGRTGLVHNGEIYNFPVLHEELLGRGRAFRSRTDTEVILRGYEEFGPSFFARLDGMFACAVWDGQRNALVLARDRWGKKPLYYYMGDGVVVFGSEIKALLAHPGVQVEVNPDVLPEYLVHGYLAGPATFYRGIQQVPPASVVEFSPAHPPRTATYWRLRFPPAGEERRVPELEAAEAVRSLLREAVRKRLISDVPLGALLSGGLDSSIMVALMTQHAGGAVRTFTTGFIDDPSYDERPYAQAVAAAVGSSHQEFVTRAADALSLADRLLWHHDQPYGDSSALPTYVVCGHARKAVTVALVGDGGDEIFAGYERFRAALIAERIPGAAATPVRAVLRRLPAGRGYHSRLTRLRRFGQGVGMPLGRRYLEWVSVLPPRCAELLLVPELAQQVPAVVAKVEEVLGEARDAHPLHRLMHLNLRTYLTGDLLVKMDRMSMAHSLETRSPFLDTALAEYVAALPVEYKIRGSRQKALLRRAFADVLPPSILRRPKHGFAVPIDAWFRGPLRSRLMSELLAPDARVLTYLHSAALRDLVHEHLAGRENHGHRLWALLTLEAWLRQVGGWRHAAMHD